ncbi:MAG: hypothetical protein ACRD3R_05810 [Terriglobales bacterium]
MRHYITPAVTGAIAIKIGVVPSQRRALLFVHRNSSIRVHSFTAVARAVPALMEMLVAQRLPFDITTRSRAFDGST